MCPVKKLHVLLFFSLVLPVPIVSVIMVSQDRKLAVPCTGFFKYMIPAICFFTEIIYKISCKQNEIRGQTIDKADCCCHFFFFPVPAAQMDIRNLHDPEVI